MTLIINHTSNCFKLHAGLYLKNVIHVKEAKIVVFELRNNLLKKIYEGSITYD